MFAVPSNDTPPIVRAVCKAVAVAAFPVDEPDEPVTFPVTLPVRFPINPLVAVIVPDVVNDVADTAGRFAAIFSSVTEKFELDCTIGNNALLEGVVVVAKSEIFFVAIYCIVHVVDTGTIS